MEYHDLKQGTLEWLQHRRAHFNASDAPAMLGISPYKTRTQLLDGIALGITQEIDEGTQRRFDDGHRFEALARPIAEEIVGKSLYPIVGSNGKYSASFDGLTSDDEINFEHKTLNKELIEIFDNNLQNHTKIQLPDVYLSQIEQQMMVSGAKKTLFMASKWDDEGNLIDERHCWIEPSESMRKRVIAGWEQFAKDLADHKPVEKEVKPEADAIMDLPAIVVQITGGVQNTNLPQFKEHALAFIGAINTDLESDKDFANADKTVKFLDESERKIELVKAQALEQTADISELFRTMDEIKESMRNTRLDLSKKVTKRKEDLKNEIVLIGKTALDSHINSINGEIGLSMPHIPTDFNGVVKGKRSLDSMRSAVNDELARAKIEANAAADKIKKNISVFNDLVSEEYALLFSDKCSLLQSDTDHLKLIISDRIRTHEEARAKTKEKEEAAVETAATIGAAETYGTTSAYEPMSNEDIETAALTGGIFTHAALHELIEWAEKYEIPTFAMLELEGLIKKHFVANKGERYEKSERLYYY